MSQALGMNRKKNGTAGVPSVAQWVKGLSAVAWHCTAEAQCQFLAQWVKGSSVAAAAAQIQFLA